MKYDVIVIGGGAAGLFCAIEAGKRGRRTLVIEHNAQVGRKILISGGGRCNFTNINARAENFISANPHFVKSALARYTPQHFIELVRKHRIDYYEKKLGQLFCRESSRLIVDMLLRECGSANAVIKTQCSVKSIEKESDFHIVTNHGTFVAHSVVVAAGGLSFPKIGATDFGYRIARQFGLKIVPTRPSLVALVMDRKRSVSSLAGVSVDSLVTVNGHSFRENVLFTHRGMSGPAILQASNYWDRNVPIEINLLPDQNGEDLLLENSDRKEKLSNFLAKYLPGRFSEIFVDENTHDRPLNQIGRTERRAIGEVLNSWQIKFCDTEGYGRAEVTIGGISTDELSSQTMEARSVPGLYFIGEVVDVTGWLGGYNFQWAWASGYAAGQAV